MHSAGSSEPLLDRLVSTALEGAAGDSAGLVGANSAIPVSWAGDYARVRELAEGRLVRALAEGVPSEVESGTRVLGVASGFIAAYPIATSREPAVLFVTARRARPGPRVMLLLRALAAAIERRLAMPLRDDATDPPRCGVTITDARKGNRVVYADRGFSRVTGYPVNAVRGRNLRFLQGPDRDQPGRWRLNGALARGEACTVTLRNHRLDGSSFDNRVELTPVHDEGGRITHNVAVMFDLTDRVQSASIIGGGAVGCVHTLEMSPVGKLVVDRATQRVRFANPVAAALLGQSTQQLLGRELGLPLDQGGPVYIRQGPYGNRPVEISLCEMSWGGHPALLVSLLAPCSPELVHVHQRADVTLMDETVPTVWSRRDGTIAWASRASVDLLGYSRSELLGMSTRELDAGGFADVDTWGRHWDFLRIQRAVTVESRLRRRDGWNLPVILDVHHLDRDGEELHVVYLRNPANP